MISKKKVHLFEIASMMSEPLDLMSSKLMCHHKTVAYISCLISKEIGLRPKAQDNLIMAGMMHDIGSLTLSERLNTLEFDLTEPHQHAERGYHTLRGFKPFSRPAEIIRYHHLPWKHGLGERCNGRSVPIESHIIHLADRASVLIDYKSDIMGQMDGVRDKIRERANDLFAPDLVDAFDAIAKKESLSFSIKPPLVCFYLGRRSQLLPYISLGLEDLDSLARVFSRVIDFRSPFTAAHSSGVAACASRLAQLAGMDDEDSAIMSAAGHFHDIGKMGVPVEILEKEEPLTDSEMNVVKSHVQYSFHLLDHFRTFSFLRDWAALHHERLNGRGYPFHFTEGQLSTGSRIMAIADVFTALTEDRPYRPGMEAGQIAGIMDEMAQEKSLDPEIYRLLTDNMDEIMYTCNTAQKEARRDYDKFCSKVELVC